LSKLSEQFAMPPMFSLTLLVGVTVGDPVGGGVCVIVGVLVGVRVAVMVGESVAVRVGE
jgi:hypothetical protein